MPVTVPAVRDNVRLAAGPAPAATEGLPSLPAAAAAVLQVARDLLVIRGWTPYLQRPDDVVTGVPACTIGQAIESVTGTDRTGIPHQLRRAALARLHAVLSEGRPAHHGVTDVGVWEKVDGRTQSEVMALLHRAAAAPLAPSPAGLEGPPAPAQAEHRAVRDGSGRIHRVRPGALECVQ
ncbi:hypothetical protein ACFVYR_35940 [Streptomyces sp. NPDC058284]|uniref:DUF6197 family protein n=1 Tax=unclassified Streptomyces TaxID=2593676 RepID=UPI00364C87C4